MSNKYIVKDDSGRDYEIPNIKRFHQHLVDFHSAEGTIHEENGYYFTVTPSLDNKLQNISSKKIVTNASSTDLSQDCTLYRYRCSYS